MIKNLMSLSSVPNLNSAPNANFGSRDQPAATQWPVGVETCSAMIVADQPAPMGHVGIPGENEFKEEPLW